jgi:hypothetical protein
MRRTKHPQVLGGESARGYLEYSEQGGEASRKIDEKLMRK